MPPVVPMCIRARLSGCRSGLRRAFGITLLAAAHALVAGSATAQTAVQFDGANDYVTFGQATATLGAPTFTLECWFKRTGAGVSTTTGTGGVTNAIPLLTKGRGEAENSNVDCNWFLGIRASDSVLVADFEEGTGQTSPGLNHPVIGTTPLARNVWYHAAATFDGTTWRLYLNGNLEGTVVVGAARLPQWQSIQHAALGGALNSTGVAAGFFAGAIDEARVWDHARPQAGVRDSAVLEITTAPGLLGRWGLNEGTLTTAASTVPGAPSGTLTNGPTWVAGAPFSLEYALDFAGTNAYVNFGNPAALKLSQFTIECWFRRDGAGTGTNTGSGGVGDAVPLITKGRGELDTDDAYVNYFLGIDQVTDVLVADFEEDAGGASPQLNHPVIGVTPIAADGGWHHAAATYDGATWNLYLDGALEATLLVGQPAGVSGNHPVALATGLYRDSTAGGFFDGALDEARIWNSARSGAQILADINARLVTPQAGLVARWGLDEGAGIAVHSSAGATLDGTITGTGWTWSGPAPFDLGPPTPPEAPTGLAAGALTSASIQLTWTDASNNETRFEIERSTTGAGGPFTPLLNVASGVTTHTDPGLTANTEYCYRVRAANGSGVSGYTSVACATTPMVTRTALDLAGSTYVGFGDPAALDLAQFTVECWFRRDAAGTTTTTGTGGVTDAIPLVTKGRGENEASNVDLNWFLGISDAADVLCADFEEGAGGASPSLNHPVLGITPITLGVWHHAAVTYDGATWNLYLDGNLETTLAVNQPCASASTQHAALGSALTSTGTAAGYFNGALDEARVWNVARTLTEIRGTANAEIDAVTPNLVARWALDEGSGTVVAGSAGTALNGTITGAAYTWVAPAPFHLAFNDPPAYPVVVAPANGATGVPMPPSLQVQTADADGDSVTVTYYGRAAGTGPGADFTLIPIPDTQYYTAQTNGGSNAILKSQMDWIVANREALNIRYVGGLGDCTDTNTLAEWMRADTSFSKLENPVTTTLAEGIPYGVTVGNHDQSPNGSPDGTSTTLYNQWFGEARFTGRSYYGGHFGTNNDNWYQYFSASGHDFIVISLEYDTTPDADVLQWADDVLAAHPDRKGIVLTHNAINTGNPGSWNTQGQAIYNQLRDNPNFTLFLSGHVPGEGRRADAFGGRTVHTVLSDYQSRTNGGNGWLRIMTFSPAANVIRVRTYSPWLGQYETDADSSSQFTLAYDLGGGGAAFQPIGTRKVAAGETAALAWDGLDPLTAYEWYAVVSDGQASRTGPTWTFTTGVANTPPVVQVTAPNGGGTVNVNATLNVQWTASDDAAVTRVAVLLSRGGAAGPFDSLATNLSNSGSWPWQVTGPLTPNAWIKVVAWDAAGLSAEDVSDGAFTIAADPTGVGDGMVLEFALAPVTPNPMTTRAAIGFAVPRAAPVRITVHDIQGREVARLADRTFEPGRHTLTFDGRAARVPAGLYFIRMQAPGRVFTRRVALIP